VRTSVVLLSAFLAAIGVATAAAGDPAAAGSATPAATAKPSATLIVEVEGLKDDQGKLHASLYASEEGFPTKPE